MRHAISLASLLIVTSASFAEPTTKPAVRVSPTSERYGMTIIQPDAWGSKPDPLPEAKRQTPRRLTLHHAGVLWRPTDEPAAKLRGLQSWGRRDKGWPDVPYHFFVAPDGQVHAGRDVNYRPESNTKYDLDGVLNVQLWGDFNQQRASLPQLESTVKLLAHLCDELAIEPSGLRGHRDAAPGQTTCPGDDLYRYLEDGSLVRWVERTRRGEQADVRLLGPISKGPTTMIGKNE